MLELAVEREGVRPVLDIVFTDMRCPMSWGFLFLEGTPENHRVLTGVTFDFSNGRQGYRLHASGDLPVDVEMENIDRDGERRCPAGAGFTVEFAALPVGTLSLLQYTAGVPFESVATLGMKSEGVRVTGSSHGDRTVYVDSTGFSSGDLHLAVFSPGTSAAWEAGVRACCAVNGGRLAGVEAASDRRVAIDFEHRPLFSFGTPGSGLTNASISDPTGNVIWMDDDAAGRQVGRDILTSWDAGRNLPSGRYTFDIHDSLSVGQGAWHVEGADYRFPGEG